MEKTKKLSKSSIAVIVLAILLALSMVMGITGAWFTQHGKSTNTPVSLTFGHIDNKVDNGGAALDLVKSSAAGVHTEDVRAVPGDYFTLPELQLDYAANIDTYLFYKTSITVTVTFKGQEAVVVWGNADPEDDNAALINELFGEGASTKINNLVAMAQNATISGYEAPKDTGTLSGLTGANESGNGFSWCLYEYRAGEPAAEVARLAEDYRVQWNSTSVNSTEGQEGRLYIANAVANQGLNYDATSEAVHNWEDAVVSITYQLQAAVCQAENIGTAADAWAACGFSAALAA